VWVDLYAGERRVGRLRIPGLEPPLRFDPSTVRLGFDFVPERPSAAFRVVVDPENAIAEITERNNTVTVERPTPTVPRRQHSSP
jgi:hypothetical protein